MFWFPVSFKMTKAFPIAAPVSWSLASGESVPIPSLLFVESQENPVDSDVMVEAVSKNAICPADPEPVIPPPAPAQFPVSKHTVPVSLGNSQV